MHQRLTIQTNIFKTAHIFAVAIALASQISCTSGRRITVESIDNWPEVAKVAQQSPQSVTVGSATVRALAATFVHSLPDWSDRNLSDREYILAGADARPAFWISYLSFELSALKPEMFGVRARGVEPTDELRRCSNPDLTVTMTMEPLNEPPLHGRDSRSELRVFRAMDAMPIDDITWNNQPLVSDQISGVGVIKRDEQALDEFDVTELICEAIERGRPNLLLAIIPSDPSIDLRRRWVTRSEYTPERLPSLIVSSGMQTEPGGASSYSRPGYP